MNAYVALFRGINVGGNNLLPMKELLPALETMGLRSLRSYIQSGNVVFEAEGSEQELAGKISAQVEILKGFTPEVLLLNSQSFYAAIEQNPFPTVEGKTLHFYFLKNAVSTPNLDGIRKLQTDSEECYLGDRAFYLFAPEGIGRSKLAAKAEKLLGVAVTARNWNTVSKLESMLAKLT